MVSQEFESPTTVNYPVEEPHFVDERTVIAARRVVPLRKLRGGSHLRGGLLAGAFALALVLGAATALLAVYLTTGRIEPSAGADTATDYVQPQQSSTSQPSSVAVVNSPPETSAENGPTTEDPPKVVAAHKKSIVVVTPKQPAPELDPASQPAVTEATVVEPVDPVVVAQQPPLVDEWQERRQRRAARNERRMRGNYGDRDLFRIDEIFEGQHRRRPRL